MAITEKLAQERRGRLAAERLLEQKQNELAKAKFDLTIEKGQQSIAQREYKLLNANLDSQSKEYCPSGVS